MNSNTKLYLCMVFLVCLIQAKQVCKQKQKLSGKAVNPDAGQNPAIKIVTGPIIGKVTTTTARILLEFDVEGGITVILTDPNGAQSKAEGQTKASIPVPFAFDNLQPNTKYTVTLNDSSIVLTESYFTTLSGESGKLNFAIMSCNDQAIQATKEPKADLWADMLRRIQNNEIQYLLQTGDQVYMDGSQDPSTPYYRCMDIINATSQDQWGDKKQEILEILRTEYRQNWNIQSVKETLAKIPSLTILDDHQIRDDWGYLPQDSDPNSGDYFYGTLARQVYYEYERQLREDINFDDLSSITSEYYYEILNDIGFFFIDYRGIRTWNRNYSQMGESQLGKNQTELIQQLLDPNAGDFANLSNFFLVSPLTMVFLIEELVRVGYYTNNDSQESWTFGYKDEQAELLNTLRGWKLAKEGREVTILDGDIHIAGYTDIKYDDEFAFLQFTSSSMASVAPNDATFLAFNIIKEANDLVDPWSFEHHDWTNKYNYGIVLARNQDNKATVGCYLVEASDDEEPQIIDSNGSDIDDSDWQDILVE